MKIILYNDFDLLKENVVSSISEFLKTQYNNIFPVPTQSLNNLFSTFIKKLDTERNVSNLYQNYLRVSQTTIQKEINNSDSSASVDKIIIESIKYFYFSLKPIINKLQNDKFTIQELFSKSRDKRLFTLMSYPEDQFSNAVSTYASTVIPEIKKSSGISNSESTTERVRFDISKILEADVTTSTNTNDTANVDLINYKKGAINWVNISLFDVIKQELQLLRQLGANTSNSIEELSKQMKGTNNENAKKIILNKIMNMDKNELQKLTDSLGLTKDELGDL